MVITAKKQRVMAKNSNSLNKLGGNNSVEKNNVNNHIGATINPRPPKQKLASPFTYK